MKQLITILLILFAVNLTAQNLTFNTGITKDSTRTLINLAIKIKGESCLRGNYANMSYLSANWTAANLKNYLNILNDTIQASFPTASLTDIRFGMTGRTVRNTYNANLTEMARVMGYQTFPVQSYKIYGQKNNIKVGYLSTSADTLQVSIDGGTTWTKKAPLALADSVTMCEIFDNGTIIITTEQPHVYRSDDTLTTITEIDLKARTGGNYTYHTPVDWKYPGDYFQILTSPATGRVGGKEMKVWGNYTQSAGRNGRAPVNVYYSVNGDSVKVAYTFKAQYYDNGTPGGSVSTGTLLGDPAASWLAAHVHAVGFCQRDSTFWVTTGDEPSSNPAFRQIHWLKGTYDSDEDTWAWEEIFYYGLNGIDYAEAEQYKSGGQYFSGDSITWASDHDPVTDVTATGVFRCAIDDLTDPTKHRQLYQHGGSLVGIEAYGNTIIATGYGGKDIIYSLDNGATWETVTLDTGDFTSLSYFKKIIQPDTNGYFLIQGQYNNYNPSTHSKSILFKPL